MTGLELLRQIADLIDSKQLTSSELDSILENFDSHLSDNRAALRFAFWLATKENLLCLFRRPRAVRMCWRFSQSWVS